jgi:AcrR family transcriptional regulator
VRRANIVDSIFESMNPRVTKSDDRRSALLDLFADHLLAEGLAGSSLRPLAKAAHISDRMLLYYFKDKAEVIASALDRVVNRLETLLQAGTDQTLLPLPQLQAKLFARLSADNLWPYIQLWLEIASVAARGEPAIRAVGERIARGFLAWGAAELDSPTPEARARDAAKLLVGIEGLLVLKSVGLEDVCASAL